MKGKDAHSLPRSPHRLRNYKKTILFGLLESLKSRFILTTSLTQRQFFRKFGKMKKKKSILFALLVGLKNRPTVRFIISITFAREIYRVRNKDEVKYDNRLILLIIPNCKLPVNQCQDAAYIFRMNSPVKF